MAANLVKFDKLGKLPINVQLQRLDEGQGVEATMVAHQAKWHKTCMLQYNNTMLRRAEKRPIASCSAFGSSDDVPGKRTRSLSSEATTSDASCFFCGESGTETLHGVATYQVDTRVRKCAAQVGDNELLARLSMGDMVALEAKYHSKCLLALYYRAKTTVEAEPKTDHEGVMSRIVLAELVLYIEETHLEEGTAPVFRLADLAKLGLTDNATALRRWMVAGPEVARVIVEFDDFNMHPRNQEETRHHEETPSMQNTFARDVRSLVAVIEELGNPFEEDSQDLPVLDTKEIADPAVIETVRNAKQIGQDQFEAFSKECIVDRTKSIEEAIHRNKLPLFATKRGPKIPKGYQQVKSLKNDVALFARLYIGCQTRDGNFLKSSSGMKTSNALQLYLTEGDCT